MEGTHDNDNEQFSFISLAAATANAIRYLRLNEKQNEERGGDTDAGNAEEERSKRHRDYVDQRLRDLAAFERRVSGEDAPRRKKY
jgi:hypothetical protein